MKKEGLATLYNGLRYNLVQHFVSSIFQFVCYEHLKYTFSKYFRKQVCKTTLSSLISTVISTTVTFPLEYWKTIQQSYEGNCKVRGMKLGTELYTAYFTTIQRNCSFLVIYWPLVEELRAFISKLVKEKEMHPSIKHVMVNSVSGILAGMTAGFSTQPLEVIKTRK